MPNGHLLGQRARAWLVCFGYQAPGRMGAILLLVCLSLSEVALGQESRTAAKQEGTKSDGAAVQVQMRSVLYHFADDIVVHIRSLDGQFVPDGSNEFPVFDDKLSFRMRIDSARMVMRPADLSEVLNSYAFAGPHSPITGISVSIENGRVKVKGKLHNNGDIPFEIDGLLSPMPDGRIRVHSEKIKALHAPVKGLMELFGVDVSDLIKSGKVSGLEAEDNDLILNLAQMLPPPHIEGRVTAIRMETGALALTFGPPPAHAGEKVRSGNYMSFRGNRLRFGKLTMTDSDVVLIDLDPNDPLDFFLDRYKDQLVAGYTKITPSFGLRVYLKDFGKLGQEKPSNRKDKSN